MHNAPTPVFQSELTVRLYERAVAWVRNQPADVWISIRPEFKTMDRLQQEYRPCAVITTNGLLRVEVTLNLQTFEQFEYDLRHFEAILVMNRAFRAAVLQENNTAGLKPGQAPPAPNLKTLERAHKKLGEQIAREYADIENRELAKDLGRPMPPKPHMFNDEPHGLPNTPSKASQRRERRRQHKQLHDIEDDTNEN